MEVTNEVVENVCVPLYQITVQNDVLVRTHVLYWEKNLKNFVVAYIATNTVDKKDDILVPKYLVDAPFETPVTVDYVDHHYTVVLKNNSEDKENDIPNYIEEPNHYTVRVRFLGDADDNENDDDTDEDDGPPPLIIDDDEEDYEYDEEAEAEEEEEYYRRRDAQAMEDYEAGNSGSYDNLSFTTKFCTVLVLASYGIALSVGLFTGLLHLYNVQVPIIVKQEL
jgi:hypothetical protein